MDTIHEEKPSGVVHFQFGDFGWETQRVLKTTKYKNLPADKQNPIGAENEPTAVSFHRLSNDQQLLEKTISEMSLEQRAISL